MRKIWMMLLLGLSMCAAPDLAPAQHLHHGVAVPDVQGEFYNRWLRPDLREEGRRYSSCCHKEDCHDAEVRVAQKGYEYKHWEDGKWYLIPPNIIETDQTDPEESPDGLNHVCAAWWDPSQVFCAALGSLQ